MILLDTDHLTILTYSEGSAYASLTTRMRAAREETFALPIVTVEEQFRGWVAAIAPVSDVSKQVPKYDRLVRFVEFLQGWQIMRFDERAAEEFKRLRKRRGNMGARDLKIASIALTQNALLLSAILRDFQRVPDLRVENWLK